MWYDPEDYIRWNRARVSASPDQVEPNSVVVEGDDVILEMVSMDLKPVKASKASRVNKLLSKVGI
jgi:hypothetical protein